MQPHTGSSGNPSVYPAGCGASLSNRINRMWQLIPHKAGTTNGVRRVVNLNKDNGTIQYITSTIPY